MAIRIVRLGTPRLAGEGLRIGTVRRPPRGVVKGEYASKNYYDVWLPALAPTPGLVNWHWPRNPPKTGSDQREYDPGHACRPVSPDRLFGRLLLRGRIPLPSLRAPPTPCRARCERPIADRGHALIVSTPAGSSRSVAPAGIETGASHNSLPPNTSQRPATTTTSSSYVLPHYG